MQRFTAQLIQLEADSDGASFTVPFSVEQVFGSKGRVAVRGTLNGTPYRSSIFPYGGVHYLVLPRALRLQAGIQAGDTVDVEMECDDEPRPVTVAPDLEAALASNPLAAAVFEKLSPSHRREYVNSIEDAKRPETRARRIEKVIAELLAKNKG